MTLARIALVLLLSAAASPAAEPVLPDFLPPGTNVVLGFSLRGLADSQLVKTFAADAKRMSADYLKDSPLAGVDPLKDLDDVIIATAGAGANAPALIVVRGRFDLEKLAAGSKRYHDVPIFEGGGFKGANSGTLALLDASTAIAGEPAQVRAAIDRHGKGASPAQALIERVQALQSRFDFWGVGDIPKGVEPSSATTASELQAMDRFEFGASLRNGLELTGEFHVRPSKEGEKLMATMQMVTAMMKLQVPPSTGAKFDLQSDQENVKVSIFIPEEELTKGIQSQKANFASSLKPAGMAEAPKPAMAEAKVEAPKPAATPIPAYVSPVPGIQKNDRGDAVIVKLPGGGH